LYYKYSANNFHINASEKVNIPDSVQGMHFHHGREEEEEEEVEEGR
jgi:hypothetical protein